MDPDSRRGIHPSGDISWARSLKAKTVTHPPRVKQGAGTWIRGQKEAKPTASTIIKESHHVDTSLDGILVTLPLSYPLMTSPQPVISSIAQLSLSQFTLLPDQHEHDTLHARLRYIPICRCTLPSTPSIICVKKNPSSLLSPMSYESRDAYCSCLFVQANCNSAGPSFIFVFFYGCMCDWSWFFCRLRLNWNGQLLWIIEIFRC
jgi:hypothetical protein